MITNIGKSIIGKYMLGQAPAYASYLAVGCGKKPLLSGDPVPDNATKQNLDFEMFRVPISSRGFVNEGGTNKIVLTAELPSEERYEITEVGLYSAGYNTAAGSYDSKTIFSFSSTENWQYHTSTSASAITSILTALDAPLYDNVIATTNKVFQTNADNPIFYKTNRKSRYESPRFLNNCILMRGDDANLTKSGGHFVINSGSNHIHLSNPQVNFTKNSPLDELRVAFTLINKDASTATNPTTVRILVDFASSDEPGGEYARFELELTDGSGEVDFANNRYYVVSKKLQELYTSANFVWSAVNVVKIYSTVVASGSPSSNYYVAIDAIRLENIATTNPLYGLVGYSIIQNVDASTIVKSPNTTNYIEFRFSIGVT